MLYYLNFDLSYRKSEYLHFFQTFAQRAWAFICLLSFNLGMQWDQYVQTICSSMSTQCTVNIIYMNSVSNNVCTITKLPVKFI